MIAHQVAALVEGLIPLFGGLFATLYGWRKLGKHPGADPKFDAWHAQYGKLLKVIGPLVILFGVWQTAVNFNTTPQIQVRPMEEASLSPLQVGTTWIYRCGDGEISLRVIAHEALAGVMVARIETAQEGQVLGTSSIRVDGPGVFRYGIGGKVYSPPLPLVYKGPPDARTWDYQSTNGKLVLRCEQSEGGAVATPSGTYPRSTKVSQKGTGPSEGTEIVSWYVDGLGLVKETTTSAAGEVLLELRAFTLPKAP